MKAEFDEFAQDYRDIQNQELSLTGENSFYYAHLKAKKLHEWLPFYFHGTPKNILDFGCGDGVMTEEVRKFFPHTKIYGTDPSSESIDVAQKQYPLINFKVSDTHVPYFKNQEFDVIVCAGAFHHIPFKEHAHYITELTRILSPKGCLILFELNPLNPGTAYLFKDHPMEKNATMLKPWYTKNLVSSFGKTSTMFYCFFPHFLRFLRPLEPYITKIPLGGLYATILKKS